MNARKLLTNPRIIILAVFLIIALVAIQPNPFAEGVAIRSIAKNSSAQFAGFTSPKPTDLPMSRERILTINDVPIRSEADYYREVGKMQPQMSYLIQTNKQSYSLVPRAKVVEAYDEFENKTKTEILGTEDIGIKVYPAPKTNIRKGLDLEGGTRVLLQPDRPLADDDMNVLIDNMKERLNVYGLSDVVVTKAGDLSGGQYVRVEIAGVNEEEVRQLLGNQGKFEAKITNETVFRGGQDITYVCRSADCSGIDPSGGCGALGNGWTCRFRFSITLRQEAAEQQAELTKNLSVVTENNEQYLSERIYLYLDDEAVDSLLIGADLQGRAVTDIQISGSGIGATEQDAVFDALQNMKRLQTILITGSLPAKVEVVQTDTLSPSLGKEFVKSAFVMAVVAILGVAAVIVICYQKLVISIPIIITMLSELILLLGLAAFIGWNIDIAAIAGIIVAIGTGVDDQIVITDELLRGEKSTSGTFRERIKRAFFIIMGSYLTVVVSMLPLWFAGAGLLRGFAITTIFGVTFGVFVTRPAYAALMENLFKEESNP